MYASVKIKTKNLHGLSARTIVYYNYENHIMTIYSVMIVPNDCELEGYILSKQLKNHKIITNYLNFKLSTSIEVCNALSTIFTSIMKREEIQYTNEFVKYANDINYETRFR